jgi:hypothetical protein
MSKQSTEVPVFEFATNCIDHLKAFLFFICRWLLFYLSFEKYFLDYKVSVSFYLEANYELLICCNAQKILSLRNKQQASLDHRLSSILFYIDQNLEKLISIAYLYVLVLHGLVFVHLSFFFPLLFPQLFIDFIIDGVKIGSFKLSYLSLRSYSYSLNHDPLVSESLQRFRHEKQDIIWSVHISFSYLLDSSFTRLSAENMSCRFLLPRNQLFQQLLSLLVPSFEYFSFFQSSKKENCSPYKLDDKIMDLSVQKLKLQRRNREIPSCIYLFFHDVVTTFDRTEKVGKDNFLCQIHYYFRSIKLQCNRLEVDFDPLFNIYGDEVIITRERFLTQEEAHHETAQIDINCRVLEIVHHQVEVDSRNHLKLCTGHLGDNLQSFVLEEPPQTFYNGNFYFQVLKIFIHFTLANHKKKLNLQKAEANFSLTMNCMADSNTSPSPSCKVSLQFLKSMESILSGILSALTIWHHLTRKDKFN